MASSSSSFFDIEPLDCREICPCRHAMDACSLCGKRLAEDRAIFMYRGDTPFCSEECRCHQILRDKQQASSAKKRRALKGHFTGKEQQRETPPAAAESGRVKLTATDVPVAT